MTPVMLGALRKAAAMRRPVAFAKNLVNGAEFLLPDDGAAEALNVAAAAALASDKTGTQIINDEDWFIEARNPAPRLVLIGAVHIAQAILPFAAMTGFDLTLVDPRTAFANAERFPGAKISNDWPDAALDALAPDTKTAVVVLTHDPKLDDPALDRALRSPAFYIGALGSRKTHASRLNRLRALGHDEEALRRVRGPVGLSIGAVSAPEIALSIIAEIVAARRGAALGNRE